MSWADNAKKQLSLGREVAIRPRGGSMTPIINSGDIVTIRPPRKEEQFKKGMIVLVTVKGNDYLHLIKAIDVHRVQIGNNHGHINGWTSINNIHGVLK